MRRRHAETVRDQFATVACHVRMHLVTDLHMSGWPALRWRSLIVVSLLAAGLLLSIGIIEGRVYGVV